MVDQDKAQWKKLVADFEVSDLSQREFASERGISLSNLRYWLPAAEGLSAPRDRGRPSAQVKPPSGPGPSRARVCCRCAW